MACDVAPMEELFHECFRVLQQEFCPLHYAELTEKALANLSLSKNDVNWVRQVEDVREKMLQTGQYGSFYIGKPLCIGGLRCWFEKRQLSLFKPTEGIFIAGNVSAGIEGAFEAVMRSPFMIKKYPSASDERRMFALAQGLVIEQHISKWFQAQYPNFYQHSDNYHQWQRPCDHDFKLCLDNRAFKVDVTGKRLNGKFGNPGKGKKTTDLHLVCEVIDDAVRFISVIPGKHYSGEIFPEKDGIPPERMIVWLNCVKNKLPYLEILHTLNGE